MILVRLPNVESERRALSYLTGRFSFKTWATGEVLVPEFALPFLATEGNSFTVQDPATYKQSIPTVRNPIAPAV